MKIHAIRTGSVRVKTAQMQAPRPGPMGVFGIFADPNWSDWLPTYAWAIEHDEGVIVVDTGQVARSAATRPDTRSILTSGGKCCSRWSRRRRSDRN